MSFLVLNQYRQESSYKDVVGRLYHFPSRYLNGFSELPVKFVYYEPRQGGSQCYFGTGNVLSIYEDTEDVGHVYAEIVGYRAFPAPVDFYQGPNGDSWERPKTMRNSVRRIPAELFGRILEAGGTGTEPQSTVGAVNESIAEELRRNLRALPGPGKRNSLVLRKVR